MVRRHLPLLLLTLSTFAAGLAAQGIVIDHIIEPEPPRRLPRLQQIEVRSHKVETSIDGQAASTTVTQVFYNPNQWQLEGEYLFPLPAEAAVSEFQMSMGGKMVKGELLDADQARKVYEDIVRRLVDPGLLEYAGRGLIKARVFPIPAQGEVTISFTYSELLPYDSGLVRFAYPLRTRNFCQAPPQSVSVSVSLRDDRELRTIYSPTHSVEIVRKGDHDAVVGFERKNEQPEHDFELFYGFGGDAVSTSLMSYRAAGEDGYFMALVTPKIRLADDEILPKDVILVLDTSGSMEDDGKIEQARKALKFGVAKLNEKDRFAIVTFATTSRKVNASLTEATEENRKAALEDIEKIDAVGGTNIQAALADAFALAKESGGERPCYLVFLTDGLPTVGQTDVRMLAKQAGVAKEAKVRIFPFGLGYDVNTWLLDTLAEESRGQREYVKPKEDMELKLSNFFQKVASPVLSDVKLSIDGAKITDVHPGEMPDLFAGNQLTVLGRYAAPGKHQLVLSGTVRGEKRVYEYTVEFKEQDAARDYLPRMWAVRRVGFLMDQINLHGVSKELKDEVVKLGTRFGIVTPWTSFLVVEDVPTGGGGGGPRRVFEESDGSGATPDAPGASTGEDAVKRSSNNAERRDNANADEAGEAEEDAADAEVQRHRAGGRKGRAESKLEKLKDEGLDDDAARAEAARVVQTIGTRTFVWEEGVWIESDLTEDELTKAEQVEYMSVRYFELSRTGLDNGRIMALGAEVAFRSGAKVIRVTVEGGSKD